MFLTVVILLSLLLTFLNSRGYNNGMKLAFILLTVVAGLRYGVGTDYFAYKEMYDMIVSYPLSIKAIINNEVWKEPGWAVLCYLFKPIGGFFTLVAFVSIFENVVYYHAIKKYVPRDWWVFAVFLYTFTQSLYLLNMSMIRQGLAVSLFLGAFPYIEKKKIIPAALLCFFAWSVHKSAIVMAPFVLMGFVPFFYNKSKILAGLVVLSIVLLFAGGSAFVSATEYISEFEVAAEYIDTYGIEKNKGRFGFGYLFYLIPTIISIFYFIKANGTSAERMLILLPCLVAIIDPFSRVFHLISRVGIYFEAFRVVAYPIVFKWLPNDSLKRILLLSYIFILIYDYWIFFTASVYAPRFVTYQTIFSAFNF